MKKKFDLDKALHKHPLITRGGDKIISFKKCYTCSSGLDYEVYTENNNIFCVNSFGYYRVDIKSDNDLFLLVEDDCKNKQEFTKSDLKVGMRVKLRNGKMRIVMLFKNRLFLTDGTNYEDVINFDNNLIRTDNCSQYDIISVFEESDFIGNVFNPGKYDSVIWKRNDIKEISIEKAEADLAWVYNKKVKIKR